jgi:phosphomethylpyrimidine synthase
VTPAEHLRLPDLSDVKEGIVAAKIAAHAADLAKGVKGARDRDFRMGEARRAFDWDGMFRLAIDGEKAKAYYKSVPAHDPRRCSMCGKMCAVRTMNRILNGEDVSLEPDGKE